MAADLSDTEWDSLFADDPSKGHPAEMNDEDWQSLFGNDQRTKANFSDVQGGSSAADTPPKTMRADEYLGIKGITDWWPTAIQAGAGIASGGLSIPAQMGISTALGAGGRYLQGEDPLDPVGLGLDLGILPATNIIHGGIKGLLSPGMKELYPNLKTAVEDITRWAPLPEVKLTEAAARPIMAAEQPGWKRATQVFSGPVAVGSKAASPELQTLANRVDLYPRARDRILEYLRQADRDIFTDRAPGIKGVLGRRAEIPLADREAMKLYLEGHRTAEELAPGVLERANKLRDVYSKMGDVGEGFGMFEDAPRVPGYSGPNIEINPGDPIHSLGDETRVAHGRTKAMGFRPREMEFDPTYHVSDARAGLHAYMQSAPDKFAGAYTFGARGGTTSEGTQAFGRVANELLNRAASTDLGGDKLAFDLLRDSLKQIYQMGPAPGAIEKGLGYVGQLGSTIMLPRSWARQFRQQGMNLARYGLGNTAEGMVRYLKDPEYRALIQASGAKSGSMQHLFNALRPDTAPNLVGRSIGASERGLRGFLSSGAIPYREDLLSRVAGGETSAALARQFREMGENIGTVGTGRDAEALRDAYSRIVGRTQLLSGEAGQTSADLIGNQYGRTVGQFRPFSLGAYRLFRDDVLSPLAKGLTGDRSELALGSSRLLRAITGGLAAEEASRAMLFPQTGEADFDPASALVESTKSNVGLPADLAAAFGEGISSSGTIGGGLSKALTSVSPPIAEIANQGDLSKLAIMGLAARHPLLGSAAAFTYPLYKDLLPEF